MTTSMTGFASASCPINSVTIVADIKCVNHRYLDLHFKIPEELRQYEIQFRRTIADHLKRGKVECKISINQNHDSAKQTILSSQVMRNLQELEQSVTAQYPEAHKLSVNDILRWPGAIQENPVELKAIADAAKHALTSAIHDLNISRNEEGRQLKQIIQAKTSLIKKLIQDVKPLVPAIISSYEAKLKDRIEQLDIEVSQDRIAQELVVHSNKVDIEEEIQRLEVHVSSLLEILDSDEAQGKKLDFLMQELNREANTLGSKSSNIGATNIALELKVTIEQIREQVQNIE
ncbi:YicC family protein [Burkholderiales bacterium]|nr:YicC family protein [Burkholderiales bacterium]